MEWQAQEESEKAMRFAIDRASHGDVSEIKGVAATEGYGYDYVDIYGVERKHVEFGFAIEIYSSDQLKELIDSVGSIIISKRFDGTYHIQIYDDYVE